jgi:ATP-dependent DNA ligase
MEALLVSELPAGPGWQFEPKWDGFRCLAFRAGDQVELRSKSGRPLLRYFPDVGAMLLRVPHRRFAIDGELVIPVGDAFSFDALQLRLHPAESRVRKLAAETPAVFVVFDCLLTPGNRSLLRSPLSERRAVLEREFSFDARARRSAPELSLLTLSPCTRERRKATRWLSRTGGPVDGVVAKRIDEPYLSGERAMLKVKRKQTADVVVGGFRYAQGSRDVGSLLLGLYNDEGKLDHVGFTSTIARPDRRQLTRELEALRSAPGFTGNAPGGPSRWSTERTGDWEPVKPKLVAEVEYDHVTADRFRHGTKFLRWRPDKAPRQCTLSQIRRAGGTAFSLSRDG